MKSSSYDNDQMDMMAMMMQIEKFPADFCSPHQNHPTIPEPEFSTHAIGISPLGPLPMFHNPDVAPTSSTNQSHGTISFMGTQQIQEPTQQEMVTAGGFRGPNDGAFASQYDKRNSVAAMREMIFRIAVMQPIHIDPESVKPPKRRNVRISTDPQSVAARHRRERISEKIRTLQRLVPGGTKMDTASMLDEAIHYVKFLKKQVQTLEQVSANRPMGTVGFPASTGTTNLNQYCFLKGSQSAQMLGSMQMFQ